MSAMMKAGIYLNDHRYEFVRTRTHIVHNLYRHFCYKLATYAPVYLPLLESLWQILRNQLFYTRTR